MNDIDAITTPLSSSQLFYRGGITVLAMFWFLYLLSHTSVLGEWFSSKSFFFFAVGIGIGLLMVLIHLSATDGLTSISTAIRGAFVFGVVLFVSSHLIPIWLGAEPWVGIQIWWTVLSVLLLVTYWSTSSRIDTDRKFPAPPSRQHLRQKARQSSDRGIKWIETTLSGNGSWARYTLIAVIAVAACARFYRLGALGLAVDEIYTGMAVSGVRESGVPFFPDGSIYHRGLIHIYASYVASLVLGPGEFSVRLPAAMANLLIVPLLFAIVREYTGKESLGLVAGASWALFPWAVEFARWGRYYSTSSLLFVATFYTALIGFKNKKWEFVAASVCLSALAVANAIIGFISPLIIGTAFMLWWFDYRRYTLQETVLVGGVFASIIPAFKLVRHLLETGVSGSLEVIFSSYDFISTSFNEFAPYFERSFHAEFPLVTIGFMLLPLGVATYEKIDNRETIFLTIFGYFPLMIISYYYLHTIPRYLFFFTPLFICGAIVGLARISVFIGGSVDLRKLSSQRVALAKVLSRVSVFLGASVGLRKLSSQHVVLAMVLLVCVTGIAGPTTTMDIVIREYEDEYPNMYFAPSPVHDTYEDAKSPMVYVSTHATENATVVTNHEPWYYYYAGEEPDYVVDPGSTGFENQEPIGYMSETVSIGTQQQLAQVVESSEGPVWFPLALSFGYDEMNEEIEQYVLSLEPEYQIELVYGNQTSGPRVYKINEK